MDEKIQRVSASVEKLNGFVRNLPSTHKKVMRMVYDGEVNAQLYAALLNTTQELRVVKAGTVGNVRVFEDAVAPYKPIKPKKSINVLFLLVLGAVADVVLALVRRTFAGVVEDPDLIEKQLYVPDSVILAHSKNQDRNFKRLQAKDAKWATLAIKHPNDTSIEILRNIRTAPHIGIVDLKSTVTMVTGSAPSNGMPFGSTSLAAMLATSGKKRRS